MKQSTTTMHTVKRIEIITISVKVPALCKALDKAGATGYTVIQNVGGKGHRGIRMGDELTGVSQNSMVIVICQETDAEKIVKTAESIIKQFGGICLLTEAQSLTAP